MIAVAPEAAFLIAVFGILLIYSEFCFPGLVVPGAAGAVLTLSGGFWLFHNRPTITAAVFFMLSLFLLNASVRRPTKAKFLGFAACVCATSLFLFPGKQALSPVVCIPASVVLAGVTLALLRVALLGRKSKWGAFENT